MALSHAAPGPKGAARGATLAAGQQLGLAVRLARRELRGGLKGFRIFLVSLALGVAAIAGIGSLAAAMRAGLVENAQALLGGDVEVGLLGRGLDAEEVAYLGAHSLAVSRVREMRALARAPARERRTLVELKGIAANYPLYGAVALNPTMALAAALGPREGRLGAVAEPFLLERLGLRLGDAVRVGKELFEIRAVLEREPDRLASAFSLGPRLMVSEAGFDATGLVRVGSLIRHKYRAALAPGENIASWRADLMRAFPENAWRLRDRRDSQPSVRRFVDRFAVFLELIGITALLVGGIGVGNAVRNYLAGKTETIAILKGLGAPGAVIFRIYFAEIGVLCLTGVVAGLALGALVPPLATALLADALPVPTSGGLYPGPLLLAAAFGVLVAFVFAIWPLARAREVPAASLFRDIVAPTRRLPRARYLVAAGGGALALALLAVFAGGQAYIAAWFVLGAVGALLAFRLAAAGLVAAVRALGRPRRAGLRLALSNICRPGAPTAGIVVSLGVGLSLLVAVVLIDANLERQVAERIPDVAPAFFFIDIQPDQAEAFDAVVSGVVGAGAVERVPMLRGRIAAINGVAIDTAAEVHDAHWATHREIGLSYAAATPPRTRLLAGTWWPEDYAGPPLISLDAEVAQGLGLGLGDRLTLNVLGREITGSIANLRHIDWMDIGINFVVVFSPGVLEGAPQSHLATARAAPADEAALFRAVTDRFDNVSPIRVRDVVDAVARALGQIATAARAAAGVTLAAGLLVLAGAVASGHRRRVYDAVILKVLGATRGTVLKAYLLEFALVGLVAGLIAAAVGTLAAWVVVTRVMHAEWHLVGWGIAATVAGGVVMTAGLGFIGTWRALASPAAPVLRTP